MRKVNSRKLNGLAMQSSAPNSSAATRSTSSAGKRSAMIGIGSVTKLRFSIRQISKHEFRSSKIRSGVSLRASNYDSCPVRYRLHVEFLCPQTDCNFLKIGGFLSRDQDRNSFLAHQSLLQTREQQPPFPSRLLAGEDSFTVGPAFLHGADRLLRSIHRQDLTNFRLDAGANYELNQIIHFLPCAHDGAAHGNLLDEKPQKIGTRIVAGGNSHGDDHLGPPIPECAPMSLDRRCPSPPRRGGVASHRLQKSDALPIVELILGLGGYDSSPKPRCRQRGPTGSTRWRLHRTRLEPTSFGQVLDRIW